MKTGLVERLRKFAEVFWISDEERGLITESADEILNLRADVHSLMTSVEIEYNYGDELSRECSQLYKLLSNIYEVVLGEGANGNFDDATFATYREQWPNLWKQIDKAVEHIEGRKQ